MSETDSFAKLEEAIEAFLTETTEPGLLLDWVLVTHKIHPRDDGGNDASTSYAGSENQTSYRTLGLVEHARTVIKAEIEDDLRESDQ